MKKCLILVVLGVNFSVLAMSASSMINTAPVQKNIFLGGVQATNALQSRGTIANTSEARWLRGLCGSIASGVYGMLGCIRRNPRKSIAFVGACGLGGLFWGGWRLYKRWTAPLNVAIDCAAQQTEKLQAGVRAAEDLASGNGGLANALLQQGMQNGELAGRLGRGVHSLQGHVTQNGLLVGDLSRLNGQAGELVEREKTHGEETVESIKRLSTSLSGLPSEDQMQNLGQGVVQFAHGAGSCLALPAGGNGGVHQQSNKRK